MTPIKYSIKAESTDHKTAWYDSRGNYCVDSDQGEGHVEFRDIPAWGQLELDPV